MSKIKVHELAKELGLTSNEIIKKANDLGISVKSHLNTVDEKQVKVIKNSINKKKENNVNSMENEKKSNSKKEKKKEQNKKEEKPVIIRREVIITEDVSEEKTKKSDKHHNSLDNNRKTDYNIVYREKPVKPLTVDELFGRKKESKEEKVEDKPKNTVVKPILNEVKDETVKSKTNIQNKENVVRNTFSERDNQNQNRNNRNNQNQDRNNRNGQRQDQNNRNNQNQDQNNRNGQYQDRNNRTGQNQDRNNRNNQNQDRNNRNNQYQDRNNRNNQNQDRNNRTGQYQDRNNRTGQYQDRNNRTGQYQDRNNTNGQYQDRNNRNNQSQDGQRKSFDNRNNRPYNNDRRNFDNKNSNNSNNSGFKKKTLDNYGIEKNIKNIMSIETAEKENVREYQNKVIDKQKLNKKFEESKNKKTTKSKKTFSTEINDMKLKDLKQSNKLSHMFKEGAMLDYYDLSNDRARKNRKKGNKDVKEVSKQKIFKLTEITIPESISVKNLSIELKKTSGDVIKKLFNFGIMATINNELDFDTAFLVAEEFGITAIKKEIVTEEDILFDDTIDQEENLKMRPPVVVVMGHVDHGKTSLLDAIRNTNVIEGEAGGITQHIGAYKVNIKGREITFLDTPGHEAFTSMRARGAQITDIAILVVAANDGIMPQTVEAINHAKAANIPIIVAVNKIDLEGADIEKIKQAMTEYELVPEEWGGDTIFVPISAKFNKNIDTLLEMVLLVADMKELKANPDKQAKGVVIEARLDKSRGPIASVLVQRGTLDTGDTLIIGSTIGRIRQMTNYKGQKVRKAGPSTPVEIIGLSTVPEAGETFYEVKDEKTAKQLVEKRKRQERDAHLKANSVVTIDNLFSKIDEANVKQLSLVIKGDVQGSVEAVKQSLEKLSNEEIRVKAIHAAVGAVNESDVSLAKVSNAIIIAFNVPVMSVAKGIAEKENVDLQSYSIIYQAIESIERAMKGLEAPVYEQIFVGRAEVRQVFKVSNIGTIAGSFVLDGKIVRDAVVKILRENEVIHEGKISTLKRFKDDAKEVGHGFECGIQIENYNDIKEGDIIEASIMQRIN